MLWFVTCLKLTAEIALMAFAARATLALLIGPRVHDNAVHRLFWLATRPFEAAVAKVWMGRPLARGLPWLAAGLAAALWLAATAGKVALCVDGGRVICA